MHPPPPLNCQNHSGNALFLILIAVALFAALSYAVTQSGRGSGSISKEQAALDLALSRQCTAYVDSAVDRLMITSGCKADEISYELPDGTNHNNNAPLDKSCHVFDKLGAGATPCGIYLGSLGCNLTALSVGQKCDDADIVYVGMSGGKRIYTTVADQVATTWDDGTNGCWMNLAGAGSASDGKANTDFLVAETGPCTPYKAAIECRALGPDWYLPSTNELGLLNSARHTGALNGTFIESGNWGDFVYWASTAPGASNEVVRGVMSIDDDPPGGTDDKGNIFQVRCVRSD